MKYEPGALVLLLSAQSAECKPFVGQIHTLGQRCPVWPNSWRFDPPLRVPETGQEFSWTQDTMRLIDNPPDSATDETLQWLPVPGAVTHWAPVPRRDEVPA